MSEEQTRFEPDPDWANEAAELVVEELMLAQVLPAERAAVARGLVSRRLYDLLRGGVRPLANFPGRAERAAFSADHQGWVDWPGGRQPVEDPVRIEVRFRGGSTHETTADTVDWAHIGALSDIVAFKVVPSERS